MLIIAATVVNLITGFFTSVSTSSAAVRFLTWLTVPVTIASVTTAYFYFVLQNELWIILFGYLVIPGIVASGVGSLLGYAVRQKRKPSA